MTPEEAGALAADGADLDLVPALTEGEARALTDETVALVGTLWENVERLYLGRAWLALGYGSWDDYCGVELRGRVALPREDRPSVVRSLRDAGLSIRAIAAATGAAKDTVSADLQVSQTRTPASEPGVSPGVSSPAPVVGRDGRRYSPPMPRPEPRPEPDPGPSVAGIPLGPNLTAHLESESPGMLAAMGWRKQFRNSSLRLFRFCSEWEPEAVARHMDADELVPLLADMERAITSWVDRTRKQVKEPSPSAKVLRIVGGDQ